MVKYQYTVEVVVDDDNVSQKYPNYAVNYDSPKSLADSIVFGLEKEGGTDMLNNGISEFGYSIKVFRNN